MHQPLLSLASHSHVNASRAFTMAAINVQSFFPYRPSLKKLSTGSHGNEFKFYFSREKSTLPFSYVSSLPTREHVRDVYFLNVFSYIYSISPRWSFRIDCFFAVTKVRVNDEKLGQAIISKRCAGTGKKRKKSLRGELSPIRSFREA